MTGGSTFIAALMAVLVLQLIEPARQQSPYWVVLLAAGSGTIIAWGMAGTARWLKTRRSMLRRQRSGVGRMPASRP